MSRYFVTGTDTGVGKTFVSRAIASSARHAGLRVFAWKPIETGCPAGELGEDQRTLSEVTDVLQVPAGLYRLRRPVAPAVAATEEGVTIDLERVVALAQQGASAAAVAVVEGAGGWRVPISREHDMAELARRLGWPVIVVARATLGTINHTLLTVEAIVRDGCVPAAIVLSRRPEDDEAFARSNLAEIRARFDGRVVLFEGDPRSLETFHVER